MVRVTLCLPRGAAAGVVAGILGELAFRERGIILGPPPGLRTPRETAFSLEHPERVREFLSLLFLDTRQGCAFSASSREGAVPFGVLLLGYV